jgi:hypothetical protein
LRVEDARKACMMFALVRCDSSQVCRLCTVDR